jgi:DNA-binding GntR family transcriptional regulator
MVSTAAEELVGSLADRISGKDFRESIRREALASGSARRRIFVSRTPIREALRRLEV